MSILTVADINLQAENNPYEFAQKCECGFQTTVKKIAEKIEKEKIKYIFLSGPTSSGKTTFSGLLLRYLSGDNHFDISLDDYYKSLEEMPQRKNNDYNFETINSLRTDAFKKDMEILKSGGEIFLPLVDFETGKRVTEHEKVKMSESSVVLIEGLHAFNKRITDVFKNEKTIKIFICPEPCIEKNGRIISKTDLRFIRRAVRDQNYRQSDIFNSFRMWGDVRAGEKQFVAKYKTKAEITVNTFLDYEPCILKNPALEMLYRVEKHSPYYLRAKRLINIMESFSGMDNKCVSVNSLLNEFIKKDKKEN